MPDRDALRGARGAGREDDPRVVTGIGPARPAHRGPAHREHPVLAEQPVLQHTAHVGLAEHQRRPFGGVIGIHRHVRGSRREHSEDRDEELDGAGGDAHPDPVATADPGGCRPAAHHVDLVGEPAVGEHHTAGVECGVVRVLLGGRSEHVEQRALARHNIRGVEGGPRGGADPGGRRYHSMPRAIGRIRTGDTWRAAWQRISHTFPVHGAAASHPGPSTLTAHPGTANQHKVNVR
ncbi:hypothetical protein GCM10009609_03840 [Pseudonocardia aurantiaca]